LRTKLIWFSTKIGISKIILEWLFSMDFRIIAVSEILPLKQGLKPYCSCGFGCLFFYVSEILPLKQGLKQNTIR